MKVTFLGTGTSQGIPVIACHCDVCRSMDFRDKRLRTSVHLQVDDLSIVIDSGPDFRQQMLREKINTLDAILYTHEHKDHTAGLDDVRGFNFAQQKDMPLYGRKSVIDQLKLEYHYAFSDNKYPGVPRLEVNLLNGNPFTIGNTAISPIEVKHLKLPVYGYRIADFTYITDANAIEQSEIEKIKGTKILVLNALQQKKHVSHFNLEEALDMIHKIGPNKAYLIHL
ncbi:MAG: MBL fold metallo-hydrolase, partial [Cyclobacteriaceae bacterium]|nr:MBL fold metallo-hydrolase [Cyclobacteriaceae bacterium]